MSQSDAGALALWTSNRLEQVKYELPVNVSQKLYYENIEDAKPDIEN